MRILILIILVVAFSTSCNILGRNPQHCTRAIFSFVDTAGKDLFADSILVEEDFQIIEKKGTTSVNHFWENGGSASFEISLNRERPFDNDSVMALFKITGFKPDTVLAIIEDRSSHVYVKKLFYNGDLLEENTECRSRAYPLHKIVKN